MTAFRGVLQRGQGRYRVQDDGTAFFNAAAAPGCAETTEIVASWLAGAPSKANAGAASGVAPKINAKMIRSDVRITLFLVRPIRMGNEFAHLT